MASEAFDTNDIASEVPAHRALRREANDWILETYADLGVTFCGFDRCELFCECGRRCMNRISVPALVLPAARKPGRYIVSPGHTVASEFVAGQARDFWIVEEAA